MNVAGIRGFEPLNAEIKTRCLTAWRYPNRYFKEFILLRTCRDPILKSCCALPLGDIPIVYFKEFILLRICRDPILKSCGALPLGDIPIDYFKELFFSGFFIK